MIPKLLFFIILGFSITLQLSAQDETYICRYLFSSSDEVTQLSTDAISLAVDAVWEASGITGVVTTTGTLTQNPNNPDQWTYSPTPNDKLVINFANGVSVVFTFYSINGYTGGTAEDFKWSHQMDFNTFVQNQINMRVYSNTYPQDGKIYWQRNIAGSALFDLQMINLNITHTGNIQYEIGNGFAFYTYTESGSGSSSFGNSSINVNESYWRFIGNNSNLGTFVINTEIINNSSGNFNGINYQYQNAKVFWAAASAIYGGYYDKVVDAHQWVAQGSMFKNGQNYGTVQFDGPVINGTYGPDLVLHLNSGSNIFLHTLINFPVSLRDDIDQTNPDDFVLFQNYPNPFNPITVINYKLPVNSHITIKVFDLMGREVVTLADEYKSAGDYNINWIADGISSGTYFCRMQINSSDERSIIRTIKMILLK
jgi:hypothetical protein